MLMQLYQDTLEAPLLVLVSAHCQQYSSQLLAQDDYSTYLLQVICHRYNMCTCIVCQAKAKLDDMIQQFSETGMLHFSTKSKLVAVCEERLIKDHLSYLHSAINVMVHNEISSGWYNLVGGAAAHSLYCYRPQ